MTTILQTGFEDGLDGWEQRGAAVFARDQAEHHAGEWSARITVAAGTELHYPQFSRELPTTLRGGDAFQARVWVRSRNVTTPPGAYFVLEFLDADGQRASISHSRTDAATGRDQWDLLTIDHAPVPPGAKSLRVGLILHACGSAWFDDVAVGRVDTALPDLGNARREVTVRSSQVVLARFGGVGFHAFHHVHPTTQAHLDTVINKRWRELSPSFVRMNDAWDWDKATLDGVATHLRFMNSTGTEVYFATWGPKDTQPGAERAAYAKRVVDNLEYLIRDQGATNVTTYCMTNELSLNQWGSLRQDLPKFKDYHQHLFNEIQARKLDLRLLATDASPVSWWDTIEWATKNMDGITGVYGGHHYINDFAPEDELFYGWFLGKMQWGAGLARARGKDFILGEFGSKQDGRTIAGVKRDVCIYWDTPQEPVVAIQLCEAAIAAINAGIYALGYWTFADFPDTYRDTYINKWGVFKWSGTDYSTRAHYYAYGLLTKFCRGPATVFAVTSNDPRLRVAALRHHDRNSFTVAVVNRNPAAVDLRLTIEGAPPATRLRRYVYDPAHVPQHPFGDLQPPTGALTLDQGRLTDSLAPLSLTVYTSAYDDQPPAPVRGLRVGEVASGKPQLSWQPSPEPDLCYYRVFRLPDAEAAPGLGNQIGSTIATEFVDESAPAPDAGHYAVIAVDQSGNASPPASSPAFSP